MISHLSALCMQVALLALVVQGLCVCVRAHFFPSYSVTLLWSLPLSCEACVARHFRNTQFGHYQSLSHLDFQRARLQRTVAEETELTAVTAEHAILCMYTPLTYAAYICTYVRTVTAHVWQSGVVKAI